jgi:cytochrome c-type biogenesis protein CcmH/NrfG
MRTGNIDAGLTAYDALLRAGRELDAVVQDMMTVAQVHKGNPVVYRVLGDGYMRQGKLQLALNTYRQALDQL